jgi:hypothetical protein
MTHNLCFSRGTPLNILLHHRQVVKMKINMTLLVFFFNVMLGPLSDVYPQQFKNSQRNRISSINIDEIEPNNSPSSSQILNLNQYPIYLSGTAEVNDAGTQSYFSGDDIEDLFKISISSGFLEVYLDGFNIDCDLYIMNELGNVLFVSDSAGATVSEEIYDNFSGGTYLIGVSIFEGAATSGQSTPYYLTIYAESVLA